MAPPFGAPSPAPGAGAVSLTASLLGPGCLGAPHIPAVCQEEAAPLPHRDSALPALAGAGGDVSRSHQSFPGGAQAWAQPLPLLLMEPALGPGVQVTSQGGRRFPAQGGALHLCMWWGRVCIGLPGQ